MELSWLNTAVDESLFGMSANGSMLYISNTNTGEQLVDLKSKRVTIPDLGEILSREHLFVVAWAREYLVAEKNLGPYTDNSTQSIALISTSDGAVQLVADFPIQADTRNVLLSATGDANAFLFNIVPYKVGFGGTGLPTAYGVYSRTEQKFYFCPFPTGSERSPTGFGGKRFWPVPLGLETVGTGSYERPWEVARRSEPGEGKGCDTRFPGVGRFALRRKQGDKRLLNDGLLLFDSETGLLESLPGLEEISSLDEFRESSDGRFIAFDHQVSPKNRDLCVYDRMALDAGSP